MKATIKTAWRIMKSAAKLAAFFVTDKNWTEKSPSDLSDHGAPPMRSAPTGAHQPKGHPGTPCPGVLFPFLSVQKRMKPHTPPLALCRYATFAP